MAIFLWLQLEWFCIKTGGLGGSKLGFGMKAIYSSAISS